MQFLFKYFVYINLPKTKLYYHNIIRLGKIQDCICQYSYLTETETELNSLK